MLNVIAVIVCTIVVHINNAFAMNISGPGISHLSSRLVQPLQPYGTGHKSILCCAVGYPRYVIRDSADWVRALVVLEDNKRSTDSRPRATSESDHHSHADSTRDNIDVLDIIITSESKCPAVVHVYHKMSLINIFNQVFIQLTRQKFSYSNVTLIYW